MRKWFVFSVIALMLALAFDARADVDSLDRGHRLLIKHGLQIQAWVFPGWKDPGVPSSFSLSKWAQSNLTAPCFIDISGDASTYLGSAPGIPWALAGWHTPSPSEAPYVSNLISIQFGDEQHLDEPAVVSQAVENIRSRQEAYPDTLVFTNQWGTQFSDAVMQNYMAAAQPDMLMFDTYPFNGMVSFVPGGSPSLLYYHMNNWRRLALLGNDGTGTKPIPFGIHVQTFTMPNGVLGHVVTESELRLNQFSAWAYGFTFVNCFFYDQPGPENEDLQTILFSGPNDTYPPTSLFDQLAELNRQSRNLGPALVRLLSTDVRFKLGRYQSGPTDSPKEIVQFTGMQKWTAGQTVPYLTAVSATNLGTENYGLEGNVILGGYRVLDESFDGSAYSNQAYFMVVNGLSSPDPTGTAAATRQRIHLTFDFASSGISALQRMSRDTGAIEDVPLVHEGGNVYSLDLELDGGTGDLFKFKTGAPFVGDASFGGDITCSHKYFVEAGERVEFEVIPGGSAYHWLRNGVELSDNGRVQGSSTNLLVLDPAAVEDTGIYECRIDLAGPLKAQAISGTYEIVVAPAGQLPVASPWLAMGLVLTLFSIGIVVVRRVTAQ